MQSSALLEWTHDVSKIATFGLVKFVFFYSKTSSMEYLEAKQMILIFFFSFKKGLHDGDMVRIKLIFGKEMKKLFPWAWVEVAGGWEWAGSSLGGIAAVSRAALHAGAARDRTTAFPVPGDHNLVLVRNSDVSKPILSHLWGKAMRRESTPGICCW